MSHIYVPGSKAREYCPLAVNLYSGCNHGCVYCYAPSENHANREQYLKVTPTVGTIENIRKEAHNYYHVTINSSDTTVSV